MWNNNNVRTIFKWNYENTDTMRHYKINKRYFRIMQKIEVITINDTNNRLIQRH
jgi:hypothetical protein